MKKTTLFTGLLGICLLVAGCQQQAATISDKELAEKIMNDANINQVYDMARELVKGGFNAGDSYGEVWIRDYNTFIEVAMDVSPDEEVRDNLLTFFRFQGETGDIFDGFIDIRKAKGEAVGYDYRFSDLEPRYGAHKNTVESDQESSLIQAVWRYVTKSGNYAFLQEEVDGRTLLDRMEMAMDYLLLERFDTRYGLIWGATTADWGDVQPEHPWGVELDENSHLSIDIYDNAFFIIAINHFLELSDNAHKQTHWKQIRDTLIANVRSHLWDEERQKFIPHLYLNGSPFPADFDENKIYYHGGTAIAIEAGLLNKEEIKASLDAMIANVKESGAPTIGLTVYPPYPDGFFQNPGMYPYGYQNGGDWTWFGARMIQQLIRYGFVHEAYEQAGPMFERVVNNKGFYEWYKRDGSPAGSGTFRGEAGVLHKAIEEFRAWAQQIETN